MGGAGAPTRVLRAFAPARRPMAHSFPCFAIASAARLALARPGLAVGRRAPALGLRMAGGGGASYRDLLDGFSIETTTQTSTKIADHSTYARAADPRARSCPARPVAPARCACAAGAESAASRILPGGTRVFVAAIPGVQRNDIAALCSRLKREGAPRLQPAPPPTPQPAARRAPSAAPPTLAALPQDSRPCRTSRRGPSRTAPSSKRSSHACRHPSPRAAATFPCERLSERRLS
jgi:hypothetical protein